MPCFAGFREFFVLALGVTPKNRKTAAASSSQSAKAPLHDDAATATAPLNDDAAAAPLNDNVSASSSSQSATAPLNDDVSAPSSSQSATAPLNDDAATAPLHDDLSAPLNDDVSASSSSQSAVEYVNENQGTLSIYERLHHMKFPPPVLARGFKHEVLDLKDRCFTKRKLVDVGNNKRRSVTLDKIEVLNKYPWLILGSHGGYCIYFKVFCKPSSAPRSAGELTAKPFTTYSRVASLRDHCTTKYHLSCVEQVALFKGTKLHPDVAEQLRGTDLLKKQSRIMAVIKSIAFCGRQGIALRGHHLEIDTSGSEKKSIRKKNGSEILIGDANTGNLLTLLKYRKEAGDSAVDDIVNNRAKFSSAVIQNELLEHMESTIIADIVDNMLGSGPFTVIADETTDCSNRTQLSISIRFLHENGVSASVEERFLRFVRIQSCTG